VQVLIGKGDGTFTPGKFYNAPTSGPSSIVIADFNKDGKEDVAAFDTGFNTMLLGNGDGTLQGDEADPSLTGGGVSGDLNGDGHLDLALVTGPVEVPVNSRNFLANLNIWLNDGKANLTLAHTYQVPIPSPGVDSIGSFRLSSVGDLNGDGKVDLTGYIWDGSGMSVITFLGNGDGSFGAPITTRINNDGQTGGHSTNGATILFGDLNGDGKPDLLVIPLGLTGADPFVVLLSNGDGTFGAPSMPFVGTPIGAMVLGDINGDKKLDVIMSTTNGIAVLPGNGDGTFQPTTFIANTACKLSCNNLLGADFNGDGVFDLMISSPAGYQILTGKGDGTFNILPEVTENLGSFSPFQFVDFNGDGKPDLLGSFVVNSTGTLALIPGNGGGKFGTPFIYTGVGASYVGDFNGDGRPDIAFGELNQFVWLFNNGQGTVTPPPVAPPDFSVGSGSGGGTATVAAGSTATFPLSLAGSGGFSGSVALTCSVAPAGPACSVSPSSVMVSGSTAATATVSVTTTARSGLLPISGSNQRDSSRRILWIFGAFLAAAGVITLLANTQVPPRRFSWSLATACGAILLLSASLISGCGGGSNSSGSNGSTANGTPAGNYTITVAATAGSGANAVSHTTKLTLVVQ
jgi:hypothetical protein